MEYFGGYAAVRHSDGCVAALQSGDYGVAQDFDGCAEAGGSVFEQLGSEIVLEVFSFQVPIVYSLLYFEVHFLQEPTSEECSHR